MNIFQLIITTDEYKKQSYLLLESAKRIFLLFDDLSSRLNRNRAHAIILAFKSCVNNVRVVSMSFDHAATLLTIAVPLLHLYNVLVGLISKLFGGNRI